MKEYKKPEISLVEFELEGVYASGDSGAKNLTGENQSDTIKCPLCEKVSKVGSPLTSQHKGWCPNFPK